MTAGEGNKHAAEESLKVSGPGQVLQLSLEKTGAEDEIRTRDLLLGKEAFYR